MSRVRAFYHGTNAELNVGDHILPAAQTGVQPANPRLEGGEHNAYATSNEGIAWQFADRSAHYAERGFGRTVWGDRQPAPAGGARARVYKVEPVGTADKGREHRRSEAYDGVNSQEWVAPAWKVTGRIDIQPPPKQRWHEGGKGKGRSRWMPETRGTQGTLPLDWTKNGGPSNAALANHPQPSQYEAEMARSRNDTFAQATAHHAPAVDQPELPGITKGLKARRRR